jgi:hypothetical protein
MHDPRTPEILAWLETLSLRERLVTLHAMMIAFPRLQRDAEWKARIGAIRAELKPDAAQLGDILREAALQAERLQGEIG